MLYTIVMKLCTGCKKEKPLEEFTKNRKAPDGKKHRCKVCVRAYHAEHYAKNKEAIAIRQKPYRKERYVNNKEKDNAQSRAYYEAHSEEIKARKKKEYEANKEHFRSYQNQWRQDNIEHIRQREKEYRTRRPDVIKAVKAVRRSGTALTDLARKKTALYRHVIKDLPCYYCGSDGAEDDHYYPLARGGTDHWFNLVRACKSCNSSKGSKLASEWVQNVHC